MLRDASRTFARAMAQHPVVSGRRRNLWAARCTAWLTPRELEELNRLLHSITQLMLRVAREEEACASTL